MVDTPLQFSNKTHTAIVGTTGPRVVTVESLLLGFGVDILIRLHAADFAHLAAIGGIFVHFNLETTLNQVGHRCAILPIATPGRRLPDGSEVLPVVDAERFRLGRCVEVSQRVPLDQVPEDMFAHSLPTIGTAEQLRAALIQRYGPMFPDLTERQIVMRGCAVTKLILD